jgi:hypothetical protein
MSPTFIACQDTKGADDVGARLSLDAVAGEQSLRLASQRPALR